MAELALAIIPLGIQTCSGLISYLSNLKGRDDDLASLKRQAESLERSFNLLDEFLKRGNLDPTTSQAAAHALRCLANCEDGLTQLRDFQEKLSSSIKREPSVQDKVKESYRKLSYPFRKTQLEQLGNTMDTLCTSLSLAIQSLQLEMQVANTAMVSSLSIAARDLQSPLSNIHSQLPLLQSSVDGIAPQINLMMQNQFKTQMKEIRLSIQETNPAGLQSNVQTTELSSQLQVHKRNHLPTVYQLASKPSALALLATSVSACSCRARRLRKRKTFTFGPLSLVDETTTDTSHYQDCHLYINSSKYSRAQSLRLTGLIGLVDKAVELTLHTTMGAGGFSISPSLTYFAVVDEERSPAFRVFNLLDQNSSETHWWIHHDPDHFFGSLIQRFQAVFRSGLARPTDLDSDGCSLLHRLILSMTRFGSWNWDKQLCSHPGLELLYNFLIAVGVPVSAISSDGHLAFHLAARELAVPISILTQLMVDVETPHPTVRVQAFNHFGRGDFAKFDGVNRRFTETMFEPLSLAILRNDIDEVKRLITQYPDYLEEKNFYADTPIFMSIDKPEILQILVNQATPEQLVQPSRVMTGKHTPLNAAIWKSRYICESRGNADGPSCPCTEAVRILLAANCPIIPYRDFWSHDSYRHESFSRASRHCKVLVAEQLRSYRQELRDIAQKKLLPWEYSPFCPSETGLDFKSIGLDRLLCQKGILSFGRLSASLLEDIEEKKNFRPIYLDIIEPNDALLFRDLGFLDVAEGWTYQSMASHLYPRRGKRSNQNILSELTPRYAMCLYDHFPNLWRLICENSEPGESVFTLAEIIMRGWKHVNEEEMMKYVVEFPLSIEETDSCSCQCSPEGCTPFAYGTRHTKIYFFEDRRRVLREFVEEFGTALTLYQHTTVLRQATFEALDMVHTCCQRRPLPNNESPEDDLEILADDVDKTKFLNDLVLEFLHFITNDAKAASYEDGNDTETTVHQHSTIDHQRVLDFWHEIGPSRVHEFEQNLASTWNPDHEVLKDLGVSLRLEDDSETESIGSEEYEIRQERSRKEFIERLEMIE